MWDRTSTKIFRKMRTIRVIEGKLRMSDTIETLNTGTYDIHFTGQGQ
jgi:hypothetical protein